MNQKLTFKDFQEYGAHRLLNILSLIIWVVFLARLIISFSILYLVFFIIVFVIYLTTLNRLRSLELKAKRRLK